MTSEYDKTCERLWEKLEAHRDELNIDCVDFTGAFPVDYFRKFNPIIDGLIEEVQEEFEYEMSEFQCSWAVWMLVDGRPGLLDKYNKINGTSLKARA